MPISENAIVTANTINVRVGASSNARLVTSLKKGDKIEVVSGLENPYAKILVPAYAYGNGGKYIEMTGAAPPAAEDSGETVADEKTVVVTANKISFRTGRGTNYPQIEAQKTLKNGDKAVLLDAALDEDYAHIQYGEIEGYAFSDEGRYLSYVPDAPGEAIAEKIAAMLEIVKSSVGGKYILGGQGTKITTAWVKQRMKEVPDYFTGGRDKMLLAVAAKCEAAGVWNYPEDYAWDCSGLFWYPADKLDLYGVKVHDATANGTYTAHCVSIKKSELRAGDCVFYKNSSGRVTHMGIVGENGVIYEAMSGYVGVVQNDNVDDRTAYRLSGVDKAGAKFTKSAWNCYGRPKCFIEA